MLPLRGLRWLVLLSVLRSLCSADDPKVIAFPPAGWLYTDSKNITFRIDTSAFLSDPSYSAGELGANPPRKVMLSAPAARYPQDSHQYRNR